MKNIVFLVLFILLPTSIPAQREKSLEQCNALVKKGIDELYKNNFTASLEIFAKAQKIAEQNQFYKQQFITVNCTGLNYYQMSDYSVALDYYLKAYSIAVKNLKDDEEMTVLNNIALVYLQQGKFKDSEKHQKKAYDLAYSNNKFTVVAMYACNLADLYNMTGEFEKALSYIKIAREFLLKKPNARYDIDVDLVEAKNDIERNKADEAQKILIAVLEKANKEEFNEQRVSALVMLSTISVLKGNSTKALDYVRLAKAENVSFGTLKDIYNQFSKVYFSLGNAQDALKYKDSIIIVKDSLSAMRNQAMYHNSEIKLKLQDSEKKLKNEQKLKQYVIAFSITLFVLLSSLFITLFYRHKQKKTIAERNVKIAILELKNMEKDKLLIEKQSQEKETTALLEKEKIKNDLESRNRKLAVNAIELAQRNDKVEQFILKLKNTPEIITNPSLSRKLDQLILVFNREDKKNDFLSHFEEVNNKFVTNLKNAHPLLTSNDLRFISYIYMNLTVKEISSIFNITIEACRKRKERIAVKLDLESSADLYDYLSSI
ncbi:tetratricopeptide repeat protein [Kaistella jeonii]|uniref:Uncharacterized protein n=1 Tax=Kaistella jeonii TaxID=266749 RepID=A0A0C1F881_9FLAO|nr:tetratricopeptide repeat protein [Kaistella jeonii]KIA89372.1 hypothetical protein OA86_07205 [Kaistella jeonii]SFC04002.1 Tetratricopeptide repeat-containing protein [Kaistella jeonii]VEI96697.1 ATP-dependent transcriptional regulator [Kaistella jeonii]